MKNKEIKVQIIESFLESKYRWRTTNGISKEINASYDDVFDFLKNSEKIIRAKKSNKKGQPLFTLREKYTEDSSIGIRIINAITNKIH